MCGISGFSFNSKISTNSDWLISSLNKLHHRGPDNSGYLFEPSLGAGLAHTRLSILDTSTMGNQPMYSSDGSLAIVFNGEIYNFRELRSFLISNGFTFGSRSDTEVLLYLYSYYSSLNQLTAFLNSLNGIFAFAILDLQAATIFVARDGLGVKPLYYRQFNDSFYFASEIKALPLSGIELDPSSIYHYLTYLWCPGSGTPASCIRKVLPGEALILSQGSVLQRLQWFSLPSSTMPISPQQRRISHSSHFYISQTASMLRSAVHRQMVSDVPVGAFLSGGLDSSSIVAFAREVKHDIHCFTVDYPDSPADGIVSEIPYAQSVSRHLGVPLEVVRIEPGRIASDLSQLIFQLDEPLADPASLNVLYICQLARQHGIKVLLSGAGGDDIFTGYRRHRAAIFDSILDIFPRLARVKIAELSASFDQRYTFIRRFTKFLELSTLDRNQRLLHYFRWISRRDLEPLFTSDFREALRNSIDDPISAYLQSLPAGLHRLDKLLLLEQRFFLPDHNLAYTDKMSMAAGIEVRVPFLDLDLLQFSSLIPPHYKQRGVHGKWVLKKAMEPYLPRHVIYRSKTGFGLPLRRWLRVELRDWLAHLLSSHRLSQRGLFDPIAVQKLILANEEGRIDATYTLFSLASIELWCTRFLDSNVSHPMV